MNRPPAPTPASEMPPDELAELDRRVERALRSGTEEGLRVLGYGEVTSVLGWPTDAPRWAPRRLPVLRGPRRYTLLTDYTAVLQAWISEARRRGIDVVPTAVQAVVHPEHLVAYVVQPALDPSVLGPAWLRAAPLDAAHAALETVVGLIASAVDDGFGLDGQLSNWVVRPDGSIGYLDVTTPLLRDDQRRPLLDVGLFLASLPWALRPAVRQLVLPGVIERYHDPRGVIIDLAANLLKERLAEWLDVVVELASGRVSPPITADEVRSYYVSDVRIWQLVQGLRHADRFWQRSVRRRPYPFLLPGPVER